MSKTQDLKIKVIDFSSGEREEAIHAFDSHREYLAKMREVMAGSKPKSEVTRTVIRIYPNERELFDQANG